jgi:VWFA-related protein
MTLRRTLTAPFAIALVAFLCASSGGRAQSQTPQTIFRTNTDLVTIPVFVKGNDSLVGGLGATDFVLTDNGVRQTVETIDSESLPVDVTILMETGSAIEPYRKSLNEQVRKIAALMRPTDRIEVLGIDNYVSVLVPFGAPTRDLKVEAFAGRGMMSVNDALVAALLRESDPDRRHLIIAMTDSIDTMSTLSMASVRDVAKQSRSTLVVSWITLSADADSLFPPWATSAERLERHVRAPRSLGERPMLNIDSKLATPRSSAVIVGRTVPARQQWTPHYDPPRGRLSSAFDVLREAADLTGGAVHPPGVFTDRNAAAIFDKIYAEFRRNYILRYLPQGVTRDGWHDVKVTIPSHSGLEVRARRGYLVEPKPPAIPPPPPPPPVLGSWASVNDAIRRGNFDDVRAMIAAADTPERQQTLMTDFEAAGTEGSIEPRREFVTALLLADAALASTDDDVQGAAVALLSKYAGLVRPPTGPDVFEHGGLIAQTSLLVGAIRPADAWVPASNAVIRFPDDPSLLLARAIVADQFVTGLPRAAGGRTVAAEAIDQALGCYDAALKHADVAQVARIRKGWLLKRLGRDNEARVAFDLAAGANDADPMRQAWLHLVTNEPALPVPSMEGESWRAYWRGDRHALDQMIAALVRQAQSEK